MEKDTSKGSQILDFAYDKCLTGIPKVSKPIEDLANDYISRYGNTDEAIDRLISNQLSKNAINGFIAGFGGIAFMKFSLPVNITSVTYVQMRMIAAIAIIKGYDLNEDAVQTFVYACIVGKSAGDVLKKSGINFSNKVGQNVLSKIPGKVFIDLNKKLGFRFITKGGTKGIFNMGKAIPILGAGFGSVFDYSTTKIIANRAKKVFSEDGFINIEALES